MPDVRSCGWAHSLQPRFSHSKVSHWTTLNNSDISSLTSVLSVG
jgi:hypothetical protein